MAESYPLRKTSLMHRESGSFWLRYFEDADKMRTLYAAMLARNEDLDLHYLHDEINTSLKEAKPFRELTWAPVAINTEDIEHKSVEYGDGRLYGDGLFYGSKVDSWSVAVPFQEVITLVDYPGNTGTVLYSDIDFTSEPGILRFSFDPSILAAYTDATGEYITLWAFGYSIDVQDLYNRHGVTFGFEQESSAAYKKMLYALLQARIKGPTVESLETALCSCYDVPAASVTGIVETIQDTWLATDKEIISLDAGDVIVSVGDTIYPGQPLTDTLRVGTLEQLSDYLPEIALGPESIEGLSGQVVFTNAETALTVITGATTTELSFALGGSVEDASIVLGYLNAEDPNLAYYLDRRRAPVGPPEASDLPATVNPYALLSEYVTDRLLVAYVNLDTAEKTATNAYLRRLREVLPPTSSLILVLESSGSRVYTAVSSL